MRFNTVGAGKGSKARPVNKKKWDAEYDRIFGKRSLKTGSVKWRR